MTAIFIAGFGDRLITGPVTRYVERWQAQAPATTIISRTWYEGAMIARDVALALPNEALCLIGHSYGADTALKILPTLCRSPELLVTIDPVGHWPPNMSKVRRSVGTWLNVRAEPEMPGLDDLLAVSGGKYPPLEEAHHQHVWIGRHKEFRAMMAHGSPSAEHLLTSYGLVAAQR